MERSFQLYWKVVLALVHCVLLKMFTQMEKCDMYFGTLITRRDPCFQNICIDPGKVTMCHENIVTNFILLKCKKSFPELDLRGIFFVLKLPEFSPTAQSGTVPWCPSCR